LTRIAFVAIGCSLFVAAPGLAPLRMHAQSAPEATTAAAAPAQSAAPEPKSQEEQNNAFRLEGPIVKWTAKTFNLQAETAARIFEFLNFGIIVLLVGVPIIRIMPKIFHKRTQTLGASLKTAREATTDANARLSAVEARLAGLDDEIKKFRAEVERESKEDEARIKAAIVDESARIVQSAEQELSVAAAHAQRSLRNFAADLAIEQAARQLVLTPEADKALIAEFISGAGKGGQN
jgi:F-type H+-transporting ATPase subunit b